MSGAAVPSGGLDVALFDYDLPRERIAQEGVEPRDAARMLVVDRAGAPLGHAIVRDLPRRLERGDLLVVNDTRVVPARLFGRKETGGRVELLLLEPRAAGDSLPAVLRAQVSASRLPGPGAPISLGSGCVARLDGPPGDDGVAPVRLEGPGTLTGLLARHGLMPLPPYIRRRDDDPRAARDAERYQTVFASRSGAVAAPTAGLHFTEALLEALGAAGIGVARLTLHVGEGTFRPVRAGNTARIALQEERYALPESSVQAIAATRERGGRVVAVGTTVVRALESRPESAPGVPAAGGGSTTLFIAPGHAFRFVDALLTNFHLPRSTLLMLVAAFAGRERTLDAYREAIARGYRFYSFGDAMLVT